MIHRVFIQHVPTAGEGWTLAGHVGNSILVPRAECGRMVGGVQGNEEVPAHVGECSVLVFDVLWWWYMQFVLAFVC